MNILLAEDDSRILKSFEISMYGLGYNFDVAENGRIAVEKFEKNHPHYDVCLMDIEMPVMDGLAATREIRNRIKTPYTPIICMTANSRIIKESLEVGMDDYIEKPFDKDELLEKLFVFGVKIGKIRKLLEGIRYTKEKPMSKEQLNDAIKCTEQGLEILSASQRTKSYVP